MCRSMGSSGSSRMQMLLILFLAGLSMARAVEVCKVADLSLVTQTGEFFLAGQHSPLDPHHAIWGG